MEQHQEKSAFFTKKDNAYIRLEKFVNDNLYDDTMHEEENGLNESYLPAAIKENTPIQNFYAGSNILITGGTGFLGKVLIEKLLRSCPDLQSLYLIIRPKKGKDIADRIETIFDDVIFTKLWKNQPKFRHKIVGINGDIALPGLGLSAADRKRITDEVSIIFHVAATVRFDEKLKLAMNINVKGSKEMLDLSRECKHLKSLVHVSTAFSHCPRNFIDEKFYPLPMETEKMLAMAEATTDKDFDRITPKLLGEWPNTYAFTKAMAEDMVKNYPHYLPMCIFRPAVVIATYQEPIRSWIDNLYGPTGVFIGAGTGVLRTLHCDKNNVADIVPVDLTVNGMIASAYDASLTRKRFSDEIKIYNYVASCQNPITWGEFTGLNKRHGIEYPTIRSLWYYSFTLNKNRTIHMLYVFFLHLLPALIADSVSICVGNPLRLLKIYKKIHKFSDVISYFAIKQWKFSDQNVQALWKSLSDADKKIFFFDMAGMSWEKFCETHIMGLRVYLLKDDPSSLPQARKRWARLHLLHRALQVITGFILLRIIWAIASTLYTYIFL